MTDLSHRRSCARVCPSRRTRSTASRRTRSPTRCATPFDIGDTLSTLAQTGEAVTVYPLRPGLRHGAHRARRPGRPLLPARPGRRRVPAPKAGPCSSPRSAATPRSSSSSTRDWRAVPGQPDLVELPFPDACLVLNRRAEARLEAPLGMDYGARFSLTRQGVRAAAVRFLARRRGLARDAGPGAANCYVGKKLEGVQLELGPSLTHHRRPRSPPAAAVPHLPAGPAGAGRLPHFEHHDADAPERWTGRSPRCSRAQVRGCDKMAAPAARRVAVVASRLRQRRSAPTPAPTGAPC